MFSSFESPEAHGVLGGRSEVSIRCGSRGKISTEKRGISDRDPIFVLVVLLAGLFCETIAFAQENRGARPEGRMHARCFPTMRGLHPRRDESRNVLEAEEVRTEQRMPIGVRAQHPFSGHPKQLVDRAAMGARDSEFSYKHKREFQTGMNLRGSAPLILQVVPQTSWKVAKETIPWIRCISPSRPFGGQPPQASRRFSPPGRLNAAKIARAAVRRAGCLPASARTR